MFVGYEYVEAVFRLEKSIRPAAMKCVLLNLAHRANHLTGECITSIKRIAKESALSEPMAQRYVRELKKQGYIKVISNAFGGQYAPTYRMCFSPYSSKPPIARDTRIPSQVSNPAGIADVPSPPYRRSTPPIIGEAQTIINQKDNQKMSLKKFLKDGRLVELSWSDYLYVAEQLGLQIDKSTLESEGAFAKRVRAELLKHLLDDGSPTPTIPDSGSSKITQCRITT
jgi:hypothetical protein